MANPSPSWCPWIPSPRRQLGLLRGRVDEAFFDPLLDTHVLLWALLEPLKLSPELHNALEDSTNTPGCPSHLSHANHATASCGV